MISCFEIRDYDLELIQNNGPYTASFKYNLFTFNGGKSVPNASLTNSDDCSCMDYVDTQKVYLCYGLAGQTKYSPLDNGTDGFLITSKGTNSTVSYINIVCGQDIEWSNSHYNDRIDFNITMQTPCGCKGSGPGIPKKREGIFGVIVVVSIVVTVMAYVATGAIYAYVASGRGSEPPLKLFTNFLCFFPSLIKDGVVFLFSFVCSSSTKKDYTEL